MSSLYLFSLFQPYHHGVPKEIRVYMTQCKEELHIEIPNSGERNSSAPKADDMKCLIACVAQKAGWMDQSGNIDKEKMQKSFRFPASTINNEELNACFDIKEENLCEKAFEVERCVMREMRKTMHPPRGN